MRPKGRNIVLVNIPAVPVLSQSNSRPNCLARPVPLQETLPRESEQVAVRRSAIRSSRELPAYLVRGKKSFEALKY